MIFWNHITQIALLGTERQQANIAEADDALQLPLQTIADNTSLDREEVFLQTASLAFNYRQAGVAVEKHFGIDIMPAAPEVKSYCSKPALQLLNEVIDIDSVTLLQLWLEGCSDKNLLVTPDFIPSLFNIATQYKQLQTLVANCCGKRGEWLIGFNKEWKFTASNDANEIWQTGTLEQRKQVLENIRKENAQEAINLLTQTWSQDDANAKSAFLEILETNISANDLSFLESLHNEKSKKVKDQVLALLKLIPSSGIVQQYIDLLKQSITMKKERSMLGLLSKQVLQIHLPENMDDAIFKTGIEKLSNTKDIDDDTYIIYQLIKSVPPAITKEMLQLSYEDLANVMQQKSPLLLRSLGEAAVNFHDAACLQLVIYTNESHFYPEALSILPHKEAIDYALYYFQREHGSNNDYVRNNIINQLCQYDIPFGVELTAAAGKQLAKNSYQFNRRFYSNYIHLLHPSFAIQLDKLAPAEEYYRNMWSNMSDHILQLMRTKEKINQTFQITSNN